MLPGSELKQHRVFSGDSSNDSQQEPASVQDHHPHCEGPEKRTVANWEWVEAGGRMRLSLPSVGREVCRRGSAPQRGWTGMGRVQDGWVHRDRQ